MLLNFPAGLTEFTGPDGVKHKPDANGQVEVAAGDLGAFLAQGFWPEVAAPGVWGSITGDPLDQADLVAILGGENMPSAEELALVHGDTEGSYPAQLEDLQTDMQSGYDPGHEHTTPAPVTALPATGNYRPYAPLETVLLATVGGVAKYDCAYVLAAGTVGKAVSSATKQVCIGICVVAAAEGAAPTIMSSGLVTNSGWAFTPGARLYIGTGGALTETCPSTATYWTQPVGTALSATCVRIELGALVKV